MTTTTPPGGVYSSPHILTLNAAIMLIFNAGQHYGTADIPLCDFVTHHAAHVHHRNIADILPTVATAPI